MNTKFDCDIVNGLSNAVCGRIDLLEKMLGLKVRENLRYSDIQKIVKSGFASEFFNIGDEIMTTYTATDGTEYNFPWLVVDFRDVEWEDDPNPHPGMVLQSKYATVEGMGFDAGERILVDSETEQTAQENWYYFGHNGTKYYDGYIELNLNVGDSIPFNDYDRVFKSGINSIGALICNTNWEESSIRQWLNKDGLAGEWWEEQHFGDVPPENASTLNSFMHGLNCDFVNIISPVKIKTISEYNLYNYKLLITYDKFWLPSREELFATGASIYVKGIEGPYFKYWKKVTGLDLPSAAANANRIIMKLEDHTNAGLCCLRSIFPSNMGSIFYVKKDGGLYTATVGNNPFNHSPCCVIS